MAMRASENGRGIASGITPAMVKRIAGGGIVAFADGDLITDPQFGGVTDTYTPSEVLPMSEVQKIVDSARNRGETIGLSQIQDIRESRGSYAKKQIEAAKKDVFKNLGATDASLGGAGVENALNAIQKAKAKAKPTGGGGTRVGGGGVGQTASGGAGDFESDMARIQSFMKDPEAEAANKRLQDLIDKQGGRADQVKKDALANLLITGGFGLAQAASQPQSQRGLMGVLNSAAKAGPGVGQAALGMKKDIAAIEDNNLKLNLEHQKYKIAERRGDRAAMMSAYQNMRMLKQHEATLGETLRHNKASEGILAQRASSASNPGIKAYYSGQAQARNLASREATKQWENIADRKALEKQGITSYDQLFNQRLKQHMKSAMPIYGVRPDTEDDEG
jgi:hypothetical protein